MSLNSGLEEQRARSPRAPSDEEGPRTPKGTISLGKRLTRASQRSQKGAPNASFDRRKSACSSMGGAKSPSNTVSDGGLVRLWKPPCAWTKVDRPQSLHRMVDPKMLRCAPNPLSGKDSPGDNSARAVGASYSKTPSLGGSCLIRFPPPEFGLDWAPAQAHLAN